MAVRRRLPLEALRNLAQAVLSETEIDQFIIPKRTRRDRAKKKQPLTVDESDRVVRLVRIHTLAEETFGDSAKASAWLQRSFAGLEGERFSISHKPRPVRGS